MRKNGLVKKAFKNKVGEKNIEKPEKQSMANFTKDIKNVIKILIEMNNILLRENKNMLFPQECTEAILKAAPENIDHRASGPILMSLQAFNRETGVKYLKKIKDTIFPKRVKGYVLTPDAYKIISEYAMSQKYEKDKLEPLIFDTLKAYLDTQLSEAKRELVDMLKEDMSDVLEKIKNEFKKIDEIINLMKNWFSIEKDKKELDIYYEKQQKFIAEKEEKLKEKIASLKII